MEQISVTQSMDAVESSANNLMEQIINEISERQCKEKNIIFYMENSKDANKLDLHKISIFCDAKSYVSFDLKCKS